MMPASLDTFLWKNFRWYRRRKIRTSLVVPTVCGMCGTTDYVIRLRNGETCCLTCREVLAKMASQASMESNGWTT